MGRMPHSCLVRRYFSGHLSKKGDAGHGSQPKDGKVCMLISGFEGLCSGCSGDPVGSVLYDLCLFSLKDLPLSALLDWIQRCLSDIRCTKSAKNKVVRRCTKASSACSVTITRLSWSTVPVLDSNLWDVSWIFLNQGGSVDGPEYKYRPCLFFFQWLLASHSLVKAFAWCGQWKIRAQ